MIDLGAFSRAYIDTNIFIYLTEFDSPLRDTAAEWFNAIRAANISVVASRLTLLECIYKPAKENNRGLLSLYRSMLSQNRAIEMVELDLDILDRAAMNGGRLGLKLPDSIHFHAALFSGCDLFITKDARFRSTMEMKVAYINPST